LAALATTLIGALGTAAGVTAFDALEAGPEPATFVARTVNVYDVPLVRPATTALVVDPETVADCPPLDVTA
jgi:hypothetical protein